MAFSLGHETTDWIDRIFRERIVAQIEQAREDAVLQEGARSSEEMENFIYGSAKSRDEYMALIAQLVMSLRETKQKRNYGQPQSMSETQVNGTSNGNATEEERKS